MKLRQFIKLDWRASNEDLENFIKERFPASVMKFGWIKDDIEYWNPEDVEEPHTIIVIIEIPHTDFVNSDIHTDIGARMRNSYYNNILIMEVFTAISFVAKETSQFYFPDFVIKTDWDRGRKENKQIIRFEFSQGYGS